MKIKTKIFSLHEDINLVQRKEKSYKISFFFTFVLSYKTIKQWFICFEEAYRILKTYEDLNKLKKVKNEKIFIILVKAANRRLDKLLYEFSKNRVFILFRFFYKRAIKKLSIEKKSEILNGLIQFDVAVKKKKFFLLATNPLKLIFEGIQT